MERIRKLIPETETIRKLRQWIDAHREDALDALRIYLGFALFAKGIAFIGQMESLTDAVRATELGYASGLLAHYVVVAHIGGGLLLGVGLVTRLAAAAQIPVLAGAAVFVHAKGGLFTPAMTLEFTLLVLFLLVTYTVIGARRWSFDSYLARDARPHVAPEAVAEAASAEPAPNAMVGPGLEAIPSAPPPDRLRH
jgi:putative oxidoreductase